MKYIRKVSLIIMIIMLLYIALEYIDDLDINRYVNGACKDLNENAEFYEKYLLLSKDLNGSFEKDIDLEVINRRSYCKTIAHRGYSNIAPENTIPAYKMAGKYGFYGAETDVYETKDGYYILMHDETVDRTTTGSGLISELTLAQIKELIVDFGANVSKYPELRVPTLEEFFIVCKEYGIVPVIEIKNINNPSVFIDLIKKYGLEDKCMIISFNRKLLENIRSINKKINIQAILDITIDNINYCKKNNFDIDTPYRVVTKELVNYAHSNGVKVNTWTIDDIEIKSRLIQCGVDFITTNLFTS